MLAFLYLITATFLGDLLARRFLNYSSILHRTAAAFLIGMLLSTCAAYLAALLFAGTGSTLLYANITYFAAAAAGIYLLFPAPEIWLSEWRSLATASTIEKPSGAPGIGAERRPPGEWRVDLLVLWCCMAAGCWLMFATLNFRDGSFLFAIKSWSDFGANLSLTQSLALGENYPTVHPFHPGETVRYHFLFWFLSANLSYLGLNVVWAVQLLSLLSLLALLLLIVTFAETLFRSRAVARISLLLFFLASSSLSYIPFLSAQPNVSAAFNAILAQKDFLKSGFPYRGDDWGALSVAVFSNQRQLLSAVGIVILVLIHLVQFYRRHGALSSRPSRVDGVPEESVTNAAEARSLRTAASLAFCGLLVGALPYWNSAVFVAACIIIGSLFVLFPARKHTAVLIGTILAAGVPQVLLLRYGASAEGYSFFKWGYTITEPTAAKLVEYLAWTFGFKWVLIFAALYFVTGSYRKLLVALSAPFAVVFLFQLSTDVFNNHKLLNIWHVLASAFIAYAFWMIGRESVARAALAAVLAVLMTFGALIDLFPLHNDGYVSVPHDNDKLTAWLRDNTAGDDLFLTDTLLSHPILFSGRKVFLANTLFAWTAGYDLSERERTHRKMLMTQDLGELNSLLARNGIDYIAIDDGLRKSTVMKGVNESLVAANFPVVFEDTEQKYGNLKIYRVSGGSPAPSVR